VTASSNDIDTDMTSQRWPRFLGRKWVPIVGPEYAASIGRARIVSIAFWSFWIVVVVGWAAVQYVVPGGQEIVDQFQLLELVLALTLSFGAPLALVNFNRIRSRITRDLKSIGFASKRPIPLRGVRSLTKWCAAEGISMEQIRRAGAMNLPHQHLPFAALRK
jgi:hypothetical protein